MNKTKINFYLKKYKIDKNKDNFINIINIYKHKIMRYDFELTFKEKLNLFITFLKINKFKIFDFFIIIYLIFSIIFIVKNRSKYLQIFDIIKNRINNRNKDISLEKISGLPLVKFNKIFYKMLNISSEDGIHARDQIPNTKYCIISF